MGTCPAHSKNADQNRGNSAQRGYTWRWRKFRAYFLSQADHALCEDCNLKQSTDVHHVKKVRDFPN
jgi:hypothetical protein